MTDDRRTGRVPTVPWAYMRVVSLQVNILERDVIEVLSLIWTMKNGFAPINWIPPEVFSLIPKHWSHAEMDKNLITLIHMCRGWRELLIDRSSLWA